MSPGPPAAPQTTKMPTASNASSLTTASSATAATTPWWRSSTSRDRVPNRMANKASPAATARAVLSGSRSAQTGASDAENAEKESATDCNWSAM